MNEAITPVAPPDKRSSPDEAEMVQAIAQWKATPSAFREHADLKALAKSRDWPLSDRLYRIANSAEVAHLALIASSAVGIERAGTILNTLADSAIAGSVRAAEVWLQHNRTLLTDEKLMKHIGPKVDPQELMRAALDGASEILQFVATLKKEERAVEGSVEAEWSEESDEQG